VKRFEINLAHPLFFFSEGTVASRPVAGPAQSWTLLMLRSD